jgi:hydroxymethylbilane synthase
MKVTIGSRGSQLALWQANWVRKHLAATGCEVEIRIIKTTGDKLANLPLTQSGTKGLFIKEIEEALAAGEVDVAVHSLKDLPTEQPEGLCVAAVAQREDARDVLVSSQAYEELRPAARVGTSSLRRQAQLRHLRSDLDLVPMRGNLDTRLRKLDRGDCDALVLAAAGVHRLGLTSRIRQYFAVEQMCPAVGQGALGVEIRRDDRQMKDLVALLNDPVTHNEVRAERAALHHLGGGCQVPIAAHARLQEGELHLSGVVASVDGSRLLRSAVAGPAQKPECLGQALAEDLLRQGARSILDTAHGIV